MAETDFKSLQSVSGSYKINRQAARICVRSLFCEIIHDYRDYRGIPTVSKDNFVESMELVELLNLSYLANRTRKIIQNSKILQKSNFHGTYTHHPQILKIASWLRFTASS